MDTKNRLGLMLLAFLGIGLFALPCPAEKQVFATWDNLEVDKLAALWLIKRHIDPEAEIRFYPKGTLIKEGIQLDTPYANIKRTHNQATFEYLLSSYRIKDERLLRMGRIVHDIEINIWEAKVFRESTRIQKDVLTLIAGSKGHEKAMEKAMVFFDHLYETVMSIK